jgi:hypothetical protein
MGHILNEIMRYVDRMGGHDWLWVLIAVMVLGGVFLRGLGSRSHY